ncbi:hypothetical protein B0H34DRAFT_341285 [Crassisporium funariophilum]|nr:hypothetical protein B0H34DRAFT_341285 [Crassisporium funariophilum]
MFEPKKSCEVRREVYNIHRRLLVVISNLRNLRRPAARWVENDCRSMLPFPQPPCSDSELHTSTSTMALRRLSLHTSALSDVEYEIYTASLRDLAIADDDAHNPTATGAKNDDVFYEDIVINVREARAWLRGRYSHVPTSTIDKVRLVLSTEEYLVE